MMTLNEAIEHCKDVTRDNRAKAEKELERLNEQRE